MRRRRKRRRRKAMTHRRRKGKGMIKREKKRTNDLATALAPQQDKKTRDAKLTDGNAGEGKEKRKEGRGS